jgi:tetratricopeptide (TPR) repeat protein
VDFQDWQSSGIKYQQSLERLLKAIDSPEKVEGNYASIFGKLKPMDFGAELSRLSRDFTGRNWLMEDLKHWLVKEEVTEQKRVFFVTGDPGTGKSAFLAQLINRHPQVAAYHFCKSSLQDTRNPIVFVCSIAAQLATQLEDYRMALEEIELEDIEMHDPYDLLRRLIIDPMRKVRLEQPILIVVDALDEASDYGLWNIPKILSEGLNDLNPSIRFVVSSRKEPAIIDRFSRYRPHEIRVDMPENAEDITNYLNRKFGEGILRRKFVQSGLDPQITASSVSQKSEGNFLYVTQTVGALESGNIDPGKPETFPAGLVGFYLNEFERIFPKGQGFDQIEPILEIILAAHEPLAARDIAGFLGNDKSDVERELDKVAIYFPEREMEEITTDLPPKETEKEKAYQAYHKSIVEWLTGGAGRCSVYRVNLEKGQRVLAKVCWEEYKKGPRSRSSYALAHLPTHLLETERYDDLAVLLKDPEFFVESWANNEFDIKVCWTRIEKGSTLRIMDVYEPVIASPERYPCEFVFNLSELLNDTGHIHESISLFEYLVTHYIDTENDAGLQAALCDLASALYVEGDFGEAIELLKMAERIGKNIDCKKGLHRSFGYQANIYSEEGYYDLALELYHEQQRICREVEDYYWLQISLGNEGNLHKRTGDGAKAMELFKEKESMSRRIGNLQGLQWSLYYQAGIYADRAYLFTWGEIPGNDNGRLREFLARNFGIDWVKTAMISKDDDGTTINMHSGQNSLSLRLNCEKTKVNLTIDDGRTDDFIAKTENCKLSVYDKGDLERALNLYQRQQRLATEIGYPRGLVTSLEGQISIRHKIDELDKADALSEELEMISKEIGKKKDFRRFLDNKAIFDRAINLYREKETNSRDTDDLDCVQRNVGNQALIFEARGDLDQALRLYQKQENICRKIGNDKGLRNSLRNQWEVLCKKGELDSAMELYARHRQIFTESWNKSKLQKCLGIKGDIYRLKGELDKAMCLYMEQEQICRETGNRQGLRDSLVRQLQLYRQKDEPDKVLRFYKENREILSELVGEDELRRLLRDRSVDRRTGRTE